VRGFARIDPIERVFVMIRFIFTLAVAMTAFTAAVPAQEQKVGDLQISAPWARATPKGAQIGGGYLKITNTGTVPDRLLGGSTDVARKVEVHEMSMDKGVMKMRQQSNGLEIKPGETVEFKPGGYHLMFVNLKQALVQGSPFIATLQFEKAGKIDVRFNVEGIGAQSGGTSEMKHDMPGMTKH
jgi:copper(I)-binding protein